MLFKGVKVADGRTFEHLTLTGVELQGCSVITGPLDARPTLRDVRIKRLRARACSLGWSVLEDVTIDGFQHDANSGFINSCEFRHVTIRGRVGMLSILMSDPLGWEDVYPEHLRRIDASTRDWSLDISEALGDVDIRGYDADRVRRDPERQAVVRFENALDGRWRDVDLKGTLFNIALDDLVTLGWRNVILSANPVHARFESQMRAIAELRDAGIAEQA